MTVFFIPAVAFVTGLVVGIWVEMFYASTAMSISQERMERKVRAAQDEAAYYKALAGYMPDLRQLPETRDTQEVS